MKLTPRGCHWQRWQTRRARRYAEKCVMGAQPRTGRCSNVPSGSVAVDL